MSRAAMEVERAVREMRAASQDEKETDMARKTIRGGAAKRAGKGNGKAARKERLDALRTATRASARRRTKRVRARRKKPTPTAAKRSAGVIEAANDVPQRQARKAKFYSLIQPIPESLGKDTTARKVLESISKHGHATRTMVRADVGPDVPEPTLGFYLGKFQRDKVLASE